MNSVDDASSGAFLPRGRDESKIGQAQRRKRPRRERRDPGGSSMRGNAFFVVARCSSVDGGGRASRFLDRRPLRRPIDVNQRQLKDNESRKCAAKCTQIHDLNHSTTATPDATAGHHIPSRGEVRHADRLAPGFARLASPQEVDEIPKLPNDSLSSTRRGSVCWVERLKQRSQFSRAKSHR